MSNALDGRLESSLFTLLLPPSPAEGQERLRSSEERGLCRTGDREPSRVARPCCDDVDDDGDGDAIRALPYLFWKSGLGNPGSTLACCCCRPSLSRRSRSLCCLAFSS